MGRMNALAFANEVEQGSVSLYLALHWHLTANHYPPLPAALIPVAEEAIQKADEGEWDHEIKMPGNILFRHQPSGTVSEIVETMHLHEFLSPEPF